MLKELTKEISIFFSENLHGIELFEITSKGLNKLKHKNPKSYRLISPTMQYPCMENHIFNLTKIKHQQL